MKKILFFLVLLMPMLASAQTIKAGDWFQSYTIEGYRMLFVAFTSADTGELCCGVAESPDGISTVNGAKGRVTIPSYAQGLKVIKIYNHAFHNLEEMTEIVIPSTVKWVDSGICSSSCSKLTTVICEATSPPSGTSDYIFGYSTEAYGTLYVPKGCVSKYQSANGWKRFTTIKEIGADDGLEINETNFPDANFRNWILSQDYGRDGVLTDEEIAAATYINVSNESIQDLKGIEYFTALTKLYCDKNQLTSLDVSKNTALINLRCHSNLLTSLDLSKNTALTELNYHSNQIYGTAMDALIASLPTVSSGKMRVIYNGNECNVMTKTQVTAAKIKGWSSWFTNDGRYWYEYDGSEPEPLEKCATPTISFVSGKLHFSCETEGVEIVSKITCSDSGEYEGTDIPLTAAYTVTAYAKKSGYADSDVATKEINVGGTNAKKGDVNEDGTVNGTDIQEVINIIVHGDDEEKYLDPRVRFGFYETVAGYSVTVNSINVDYNLTIGTDAVGTVLNTTADYPTWDTANGQYSVVQPNETNTNTMLIKLDYTLTSEDGSGENIVIRNAEVVVPAEVLQWQPNKDYTYILKISDNPDWKPTMKLAELFPITLDRVEVTKNNDSNVTR